MTLTKLKFLLPKSLFPDFFLDWNLDNWQEVYRNQTNLLEIFHQNSFQKLPQVIVFDNSKEQLNLSSFTFELKPNQFQIDSSLETQELLVLPYLVG
ncbi:hypothetical protein F7734_55665 [Scytonema sp. UIC 10036]|uniref:hypothetical protein n=1 Tax=Scytonema sp. UIC 10036 TaxID=2304196 RepID=UPI0012DA53C7|nr:hypothetical protein [Scytonema sp. UIC 10036]MUH01020.1 hypothetical protein [Scytonema sp. UIC 10036]